jgi:hypothetical protein
MKSIAILLSSLTLAGFLSFTNPNHSDITGGWMLKKHVIATNGFERVCRDSSTHWHIIFQSNGSYFFSDGSKKGNVSGEWTLEMNNSTIWLTDGIKYATRMSDHLVKDRKLKVLRFRKNEMMVQENICSGDSIGITYYKRIRTPEE